MVRFGDGVEFALAPLAWFREVRLDDNLAFQAWILFRWRPSSQAESREWIHSPWRIRGESEQTVEAQDLARMVFTIGVYPKSKELRFTIPPPLRAICRVDEDSSAVLGMEESVGISIWTPTAWQQHVLSLAKGR